MLTRGAAAGFARNAKNAGVLEEEEEEEEEEAENFLKSKDLGFLRHTRLPLVRMPHSTIAISPNSSLPAFLSVCVSEFSLALSLFLSLSLSQFYQPEFGSRADGFCNKRKEREPHKKQTNQLRYYCLRCKTKRVKESTCCVV